MKWRAKAKNIYKFCDVGWDGMAKCMVHSVVETVNTRIGTPNKQLIQQDESQFFPLLLSICFVIVLIIEYGFVFLHFRLICHMKLH